MSVLGRPLRGLRPWQVGLTLVGGGALGAYATRGQVANSGMVRFGRCVLAVAQVVVDYKKSLSGVGESEYDAVLSQCHVRSALRLRAMCCVNGGVFIKVGQHIGALDYLLPSEYTDTMKVLHSDAPRSSLEEVKLVIKEELGTDADQLFEDFSDDPMGTASLAQVHRATLRDGSGSVVAVKVQHPNVLKHSRVDMATMELLVNLVAWLFPEFQFQWIAEETKRNLPLELDFVNEGKNCERVGRMFKEFSWLKVPSVHWGLTTRRVLTMEFCEGGQINDLAYMQQHHIDVNQVSRCLGRLYSEMIFVTGYIHCDPHPGNVLVQKTPCGLQLTLLDHGLYTTISDDFRVNYSKLWLAIIAADMDKIRTLGEKLGVGHLYGLFACMVSGRSWDSIQTGLNKQKVSAAEDAEIRENATRYMREISSILNRVPRQMLLIFKTNDLLRGLDTRLGTRADAQALITMSRCCVRAVFAHERRTCGGWWACAVLTVREHWLLFTMSLYEWYLRISSLRSHALT